LAKYRGRGISHTQFTFFPSLYLCISLSLFLYISPVSWAVSVLQSCWN
jgi:hypothetical protein